MLKRTLLTSALLLAAGAATADIQKDLQRCTEITAHLKRLACFDGVAKKHSKEKTVGQQILAAPSSSSPTRAGSTGKWRTDISTNPLDDSKTVVLILEAESPKMRRGKPTLFLRCQSNRTEMYINWSTFVTTGDAWVTTRIGNNKATSGSWGTSTSNESTFAPRAIATIREMMQATQLIAQVTPHGENPATATFDISGLAEAIKPLRETCNW